MKNTRRFAAFALAAAMTLSLTGCSTASTAQEETTADEAVKIGVLTYNATDSEMLMFRSYLKNYLGEAFNVDYYYADTIATLDDEKAFIDQAKEIGCQGVIAFTSNDLTEIVDYCGEDMFYALQNMTPTAEEFEVLKSKPQFLGVASPSNDDEYTCGAELAGSLMRDAADSSKVWLVFTGGASYGNNMHTQRAKGMLDTLTAAGYELSASVDELLTAQAPLSAASGKDGGEIVICPGYPSVFTENVDQALAMCSADILISTCALDSNEAQIAAYEQQLGKELKVGVVDCFSETIAAAVESEKVDCLAGKYAAMAVPSFIAMMNAVNGDMDLVKADGEAYWIEQKMWSADSKDAFMQLYSDSTNIYDNIYSTEALMKLIGAYNENATYEDFMNLMI